MAAALTQRSLRDALDAGLALDLSDCVFLPWRPATPRYYALLAGLVRHFGLTSVLELGSLHGGSMLAMRRGVGDDRAAGAKLVTVDVADLSRDALAPHPEIQRVTGDALAPAVIRDVTARFSKPIDLLFVDVVHTYWQTREPTAVYANRLKPRVIALDDTRHTRGMRRLWKDIEQLDVGTVHDVSELVERSGAGFGLIECREGARWPELTHGKRAALRAASSGRRAVAQRVPMRWKGAVRSLVRG